MIKSVVIVIAGVIGSGKDTIMNIIAGYASREGKYKKYRDIEIIRFADPIKKGIAGMFGHHPDFLLSDKNKKLKTVIKYNEVLITYGRFQQLFGDKMREIDNDIFANIVIHKIRPLDYKLIIIPDLRFVNEQSKLLIEAATNRSRKFIFIKLIGQFDDKYEDERDPNHQSETEVNKLSNEDFDYRIECKYRDRESMKNTIKKILITEGVL